MWFTDALMETLAGSTRPIDFVQQGVLSASDLPEVYDMELGDLIGRDCVVSSNNATSKKQVLEELAEISSKKTGVPVRDIFDTLLQRERLGSTGVGNGIAIPHGKLANLPEMFGVFARLENPIDFDALDNLPVDIIFLLLAPENAGADHLKALARIARFMRDADMIKKLRQTRR